MPRNGPRPRLAVEPANPQDARAPVDLAKLETACRLILDAIGEDASRDGLRGTPARFARLWRDFARYDPGETGTTFAAAGADQMVVVSGVRVWSFCEHHLLPFWCDVSVGYLAGQRVLGLSKFARIARKFAHRLQVQERLTEEVADAVSAAAGTDDVAVLARGEHLCMTMRGVRSPAMMTTSVVRGAFRAQSPRDEFLRLALANPAAGRA